MSAAIDAKMAVRSIPAPSLAYAGRPHHTPTTILADVGEEEVSLIATGRRAYRTARSDREFWVSNIASRTCSNDEKPVLIEFRPFQYCSLARWEQKIHRRNAWERQWQSGRNRDNWWALRSPISV